MSYLNEFSRNYLQEKKGKELMIIRLECDRILASRPLDVYKILSKFEKRVREVEGGRNKIHLVPQYFLGVVQPEMEWQTRQTDFKPDDVFDHTRLFRLEDIVKLNPKSKAEIWHRFAIDIKKHFWN